MIPQLTVLLGVLALALSAGCTARSVGPQPAGGTAPPPDAGQVVVLDPDRFGGETGRIEVTVGRPGASRRVQDFPDTTRRFLLTVNAVDMVAPATAEILIEGAVATAGVQIAVPAGSNRSLKADANNLGGMVVSRGATSGITVSAGQTTAVSLTMTTLVGDVSGSVKNFNTGGDYANVTVAGTLATTSTDASGSYLLRDQATGSQFLTYKAPGAGAPLVTQPVTVFAATTSAASPVGLFGAGPTVKKNDTSTYYGVTAVSASEAFALGRTSGSAGVVVRTTDGGQTWTTVRSVGSSTYYELKFLNATDGFLLGTLDLCKTTDGGATWSQVTSTLYGYSLGLFDALNLAIAYSTTFKRSADGGLTTAGQYTTPSLCGIWPISSSILWGTTTSAVQRSLDGGATWTSLLSVSNNGYNTLAAQSASTAIIVADDGRIQQTVNGGANWTVVYSVPDAPYLYAAANLGTGWIAAGNNRAVVRAPGASAWTTQSLPGVLNALDCLPDGTACWGAGNNVVIKF
ncbi:MAG: hypothetical protein FJZ01_12790 [Candidatus Sericytochromatia bacterium]|nr:hypothetical protein [Candidatus Tanganyikabacteria bacterium]